MSALKASSPAVDVGRAADVGPTDLVFARSLLSRCTFPAPGEPLCCAVSGGPDSLALLVLATLAGCAVTAVHVDHGLRAGSSAEAAVVAATAGRFGAAFRAVAVDVPPGANVEARARAARYRVLPAGVATGHTMDDQAETVLANALRGSGPDGLAGMRPGTEHPLLGLRRAETHRVCEEAGLDPVVDPSNHDPRHLRNRVRHELLPLCADIAGRDPVPVLARLAGLAGADAAALDMVAAAAVPDPADTRVLRRVPVALARRAVRGWLRAQGTTPESGGRPLGAGGAVRHPPTLADVHRVLAVAAGRVRATEVAGGWRVRRSAGRLVAEPPGSVQSRR